MPKLVAVYAKQEEIPEAQRDLYTEVAGQWLVDLDIEADPRVHGLKSGLQKERKDGSDLKGELKKFRDLGATPEELADMKTLAASAKDGNKGAKEQLEALKKQLVDEHAKVIKAKDDTITELNSSLYETLAENAARMALEEADGAVELLLPHVLKQLKVDKGADGKRRALVIDEKGQTRIADAAGTEMTPKQLVAEMKSKDAFGSAFAGSGATGSGAPPKRHTGGTGSGPNLSPEQRLTNALS